MTLDEPVSSLRPFRYAARTKGGNCTSILNLYLKIAKMRGGDCSQNFLLKVEHLVDTGIFVKKDLVDTGILV